MPEKCYHPRLALEHRCVEDFGQGVFFAGTRVLRRGGPDRLGQPLLPKGGHAGSGVSCGGVPERLHACFAVQCSLTVPAGAMAKGQSKHFCSCIVCMH